MNLLAVAAVLFVFVRSAVAQPPNQSLHVSTVAVTVETLDPVQRWLVGRTDDGRHMTVVVDPSVSQFDNLRKGDRAVISFIEAVVVKLVPGAKLTNLTDTTATAQAKVVDPLARVQLQLTAVVTIDAVDRTAQTVLYRG